MRRRVGRTIWLMLLTMTPLLLWSAHSLAQPEHIGRVTALQGRASVQHSGSGRREPLSAQSLVYRADRIETLEASKIKITLVDDTELTLGERSTMTLSKFVYLPAQQTHQGVVKIG